MLFAAPPSWHETSARAAYFDTVKISIDAGNAANCKNLYSGKIVSNCGVRAAARIRGPNQGRRRSKDKAICGPTPGGEHEDILLRQIRAASVHGVLGALLGARIPLSRSGRSSP